METEEILAAIQNAAETIATPNWAAWLSALAALGAVAVAIIVAVRQNNIANKQTEIAKAQTEIAKIQAEISKQQNKIALFEKRFLIYDKVSKIFNIAYILKKLGKSPINVVHRTISSILEYDVTKDLAKPDSTTAVEIQCTRELVKQASFLFPEISRKDVDDLWSGFQDFFLSLTLEVARNPTMPMSQFKHPSKDKFVLLGESFGKKYTSLMRKSLDLNEVL